jgi:hypothetical protein
MWNENYFTLHNEQNHQYLSDQLMQNCADRAECGFIK